MDLFEKCPYHFKLRYVDELIEIPSTKPDNPLHIGSGLHKGIEEGVEAGVHEYFKLYPIVDTEHEIEALKLEYWIPKVQEYIQGEYPDFEQIHEYHVIGDHFHGYVDLILTNEKNESIIIDFKYSNNVDNYVDSEQLHIYKYYLEEEGFNVRGMGFLFVPKTKIRQKKNQNFMQFKRELREKLDSMKLTFVPIPYDEMNVIYIQNAIIDIEESTEYPRNPNDECFTCKVIEAKKKKSYHPLKQFEPPFYLDAIQNTEGEILMQLPSPKRRETGDVTKRVLWMYGAPMSGKSTFANDFPTPLVLNTDGNAHLLDAPFISIANEVKSTGRVTKTTHAWELFKDTILELEKGENDFKTIIIDLLEDTYEACRLYIFDKHDIEHESDSGYGKGWDLVRTEFLSTIKRIINLNYENIIFISHEDISKDVTRKSGDKITAIKPNLQEKVANKVSGMVHIIGRVEVNNDERILNFKPNDYVFSGGRIDLDLDEIELDANAFIELYDVSKKNRKKKKKQEEEKLEQEVEESKKRRKSRKKDKEEPDEEPEDSTEEDSTEEETTEEEPKRKRRKRKSKSDSDEKKTRKSRRNRKSEPEETADDVEDDETPPGVDEEEPEEDEEEETPKRKKRARSGGSRRRRRNR